VREKSCLLIPDQNLFRLEAGKLLDTFIDVAGDKILVASMQFGIGFLNDWYPKLP